MAESVLSAVLLVAAEVISTVEGAKRNNEKSQDLAMIWDIMIDSLVTLNQVNLNHAMAHKKPLIRMNALGVATSTFLRKFNARTTFALYVNWRKDRKQLDTLKAQFFFLVSTLNLGVAIDTLNQFRGGTPRGGTPRGGTQNPAGAPNTAPSPTAPPRAPSDGLWQAIAKSTGEACKHCLSKRHLCKMHVAVETQAQGAMV
jgi:hypothetical protein